MGPKPRPDTPCPDFPDLNDWAQGRLSEERRDALLEHVASCDACTEKIAFMKRFAEEAPPAAPSKEAEAAAKRALRGAGRSPRAGNGRRHAWLGAFLLFLALSFVWKEYFLQMLLLAAVAAAKWIADGRSHRLLIDVRRTEGSPETEKRAFRSRGLFRSPDDPAERR
jgi:hypothetical protein